MESRFNRYIDFADYSAEELMNIFRRQLASHDYHATAEALECIAAKLTRDVAAKDENFGNARHVRNLFEKTLENQATRLASASASLSRTDLQTILPADVPS